MESDTIAARRELWRRGMDIHKPGRNDFFSANPETGRLSFSQTNPPSQPAGQSGWSHPRLFHTPQPDSMATPFGGRNATGSVPLWNPILGHTTAFPGPAGKARVVDKWNFEDPGEDSGHPGRKFLQPLLKKPVIFDQKLGSTNFIKSPNLFQSFDN